MDDGAGMEATAVDSEHEEQEEEEEEDEQEPAALRKKLSSLFDQVSKLEATLAEKETPPPSKSVARAAAAGRAGGCRAPQCRKTMKAPAQVLNPERQPQVVRHDSQNAGKDCAEESAETLVALTS
ncbi:hypothetical protein AK812_SmicGene40783 [Symbiodinium microadriaticum]|uniref:Uncharacterized protein n=1 Tax=Symbiodinium microadriaticum TaxID=2951 RepID=A0A1Q9C7T8_SYMMI|nr:hypothetical protein AK812_SmicGene40783 [Symbiodinium microadriaticum]